MIKHIGTALTLAALGLSVPHMALAQDNTTVERAAPQQNSWYGEPLALSGQDVVSFRDAAGPVAGSQEYTTLWDNTEWRFSSAQNRDAFAANPTAYVPEFGGYCPVALTQGEAKIGTAEHFTIVDEKLYLNYNQSTENSFEDNPVGYIAAAKLSF